MRERHRAWIRAQSLQLPRESLLFTRERVLEGQRLVPEVDLVRGSATRRDPRDPAGSRPSGRPGGRPPPAPEPPDGTGSTALPRRRRRGRPPAVPAADRSRARERAPIGGQVLIAAQIEMVHFLVRHRAEELRMLDEVVIQRRRPAPLRADHQRIGQRPGAGRGARDRPPCSTGGVADARRRRAAHPIAETLSPPRSQASRCPVTRTHPKTYDQGALAVTRRGPVASALNPSIDGYPTCEPPVDPRQRRRRPRGGRSALYPAPARRPQRLRRPTRRGSRTARCGASCRWARRPTSAATSPRSRRRRATPLPSMPRPASATSRSPRSRGPSRAGRGAPRRRLVPRGHLHHDRRQGARGPGRHDGDRRGRRLES